MILTRHHVTAICASILSANTALATGTIFLSDQTFAPTDYTEVFTFNTGGQFFTQDSTGGNSGTNPDPFRRVRTTTNAAVSLAHLNTTLVLDPAITPVESISYTIDARAISAFGQGMGFGLAASQGGVVYLADNHITGSSGASFAWNTFGATDLLADAFVNPNGPEAIDWTANGSPITFGFYTANSSGNGITVGYDNLNIEATVVPAAPVSALLALGGLAGVRRNRQRS